MEIKYQLEGEHNASKTPRTETENPRITSARRREGLPWFMSVSLSQRPRCLGCGGRLLPKVVKIQADHALCEKCADFDWDLYRPYWRGITSIGPHLELTTSRGIIFWTPPEDLPDIDGYIRWLELRDVMRASAS